MTQHPASTAPGPPNDLDPTIIEALYAADSILALLHHRRLLDTEENRRDVANALTKVRAVTDTWSRAR